MNSAPSQVSKSLTKALGRAFRWRKLLESGEYSTIDEIGKTESVNHPEIRVRRWST
jgi:hypothetical protein